MEQKDKEKIGNYKEFLLLLTERQLFYWSNKLVSYNFLFFLSS